MAQPTASDVHVNRPLTNILLAYLQDPDAFVAPTAFPILPVMKRSDVFFKFARADFFRDEMQVRAPSTESAGSGYNLATGSYECTVYGLHKDIDDATRANEDAPLDSDRDAAIWLGQQALIKMDRLFAQKAFTTGIWTGSTGGTDLTGVAGVPGSNQFQQFQVAGSTPVETIRAQITPLTQTGISPRDLVLTVGQQVWNVIADHSELVGRLSYNDLRVFTEDKLAALLGIKAVKVARSVVNTSNEGAATPTYSFIHGKHMLLNYAPDTPALLQPAAGYTFAWRGYLGMQPSGSLPGTDRLRGVAAVSKFRMPALKADRIESEMALDINVTGADLGVFFANAVA